MDHARHMSSPSPTSSFLFHHSDRPFRSSNGPSDSPMTSLLSSSPGHHMTSAEDCFSTSSSSVSSAGATLGGCTASINNTCLSSRGNKNAHSDNNNNSDFDMVVASEADLASQQDNHAHSPLVDHEDAHEHLGASLACDNNDGDDDAKIGLVRDTSATGTDDGQQQQQHDLIVIQTHNNSYDDLNNDECRQRVDDDDDQVLCKQQQLESVSYNHHHHHLEKPVNETHKLFDVRAEEHARDINNEIACDNNTLVVQQHNMKNAHTLQHDDTLVVVSDTPFSTHETLAASLTSGLSNGAICKGSSRHDNNDRQEDNEQEDDDDDDDVDEDEEEAMRNMLSGSTSSSTSTMPLLTDGHVHSHHSFSRISLEEYSPLSLSEECENALTISPSSMVGAVSFKSSMHGLKLVDDMVTSGVIVHDVDVGDARSLSPSLLSAHSVSVSVSGGGGGIATGGHTGHVSGATSSSPTPSLQHNQLWSNSSTAITQNTSLAATSFLSSLSHHHPHHPHHHHHQQQLNSFMQQLGEPQSLDEPPTIVSASSTTTPGGLMPATSVGAFGGGASDMHARFMHAGSSLFGSPGGSSAPTLALHRPSSEPPPDSGVCASSGLLSSASTPSAKHKTSTTAASLSPRSDAPASTGSNRNKTSTAVAASNKSKQSNTSLAPATSSAAAAAAAATTANTKSRARRTRSRANRNSLPNTKHPSMLVETAQAAHAQQQADNKLHLQLNHHKKLQELQQRLFGTTANPSADSSQAVATTCNKPSAGAVSTATSANKSISASANCTSKSTTHKSSSRDNNSNNKSSTTTQTRNRSKQEQPDSSASNKSTGAAEAKSQATKSKPSRPTRSRRARLKSSASDSAVKSDNSTSSGSKNNNVERQVETAEPDTTTKNSDCIKLADLLSNANSSNTAAKHDASLDALYENAQNNYQQQQQHNKQQQQQMPTTIQLQVSPSLTVVTTNGNGQLVQQSLANIQHVNGQVVGQRVGHQQQQQQQQQLKNVLTNLQSSLKISASDGSATSEWSAQQQQQQQQPGNQVATGTHQFAIQVICQDGTSLVLPVSSAAGLNAAVSLNSQQLQAAIANSGASNRTASSTVVPLMSVSNIVAHQQQQQQQQQQQVSSAASNSSNGSTTSSNGSQSSGLAASSPTLAALLDAGLNRHATNNEQSHSYLSTNLLRKLVCAGSVNSANGASGRAELTISAGSSLNLANCANLITVCNANAPNGPQAITHKIGDKRIKLEQRASDASESFVVPSAQLTIVDSQGLIVANGNDKLTLGASAGVASVAATASGVAGANSNNNNNNKAATCIISTTQDANGAQHKQDATRSATATSDSSSSSNSNNNNNNNSATTTATKSKMGSSSTGNRQVDPAQPFRCEHCNSTFTRLGNFTRHKKIHTVPTKDGQRFKCDVCSKSFLQRCDLARHLHIHRGTEPHRCNICGKGYIRHSDLVTHQRFHNKEKPFGCPQCSKGFCQRGDLNRHLRSIHLQMKPILCPCCNKKFAKQETLLRHLNTVHRGKTNTGAIISDIPPNTTYTITTTTTDPSGEQPQTNTISVVTNAALLGSLNASTNTNGNSSTVIATSANAAPLPPSSNAATDSKNPGVASLRAIQATLEQTSAVAAADGGKAEVALKQEAHSDDNNK